jgi:hypothetical protein
MKYFETRWDSSQREEIAKEIGDGFTARQIMDRWYYDLRPGISRHEFTIEERRQVLKLSNTNLGNWSRIAAQIGTGTNRICAQVKSAVSEILAKLKRIGISLQTPEDADALPDEDFRKTGLVNELQKIRNKFFETRIRTLEAKLEAGKEAVGKKVE